MGVLPMLEYDGMVLCQSFTIARFLAKKAGLAGESPEEEAKCDMIVDLVLDYYNALRKVFFAGDDEEIKKAVALKVFAEDVPKFLDIAEKLLGDAGGNFFVGDKLTWADIAIYNAFESLISPTNPSFVKRMPWFDHELRVNLLESRPLLLALLARVSEHERLAKWLAIRPSDGDEPF